MAAQRPGSVHWPVLFAGTLVIAACGESIQEPWVNEGQAKRLERLQSEPDRDAETEGQLRERLATGQRDR